MPKRRKDNVEHEEESSARPIWSGTITFGLVSVPVNLFPGNRSAGVAFRMLGPNGVPLSRRYFSAKTEKELEDDDIVRGYEFKEGKYVLVSDEELERLAPERSRDIELKLFVPREEVSPMYFERAYFLAPAGSSTKAYKLLAETMERLDRTGIGRFVMRGKEYLVAIFSSNQILSAQTMRFADEVRSPKEVGLPEKPKVAPAAVRKFEKFIAQKSTAHLSREELRDAESERLLKLIDKKHKREKDVVESAHEGKKQEKGPENVVDLMEVLKHAMNQRGRASKSRQRQKAA